MSHITDLMENSPPGEMPSPMEYRWAWDQDVADGKRERWEAAGFWRRVALWFDGQRP